MSWQAVSAALRHRVGSSSWKAVLLVVAESAQPDGTGCTMRYQTIAARAECSVVTVKRAVPAMIRAGVLKGSVGDLAVELDDEIDMREGLTVSPQRSPGDTRGQTVSVSQGYSEVSEGYSTGISEIPLEEPVKNRSTTDTFDEFWSVYPLRKAKGAARRAWATACKKADPEAIIKAAGSYRDDPRRNPAYTAHASTWLNGERWDDEAEASCGSGEFYVVDGQKVFL